MNEKQAQELFNQLFNDGYDVRDIETFKGALRDPNKSKELYEFFSGEGYDLGPAENFMLTETVEEPSFKEVEATPNPEMEANIEALQNPTTQFPLEDNFMDFLGDNARSQMDTIQLQDPLFTNRMQREMGLEPRTISDKAKEVVSRYDWADDNTTSIIGDWVDSQPVPNQQRLAEGEWTEARAANVAETAIRDRLSSLSEDMGIISERLDEAGVAQPVFEQYIKDRAAIQSLPEEQQEQAMQLLDAKYSEFGNGSAGTFLNEYYEAGIASRQLRDKYSEVITNYPEEASRRYRLKSADRHLDVQPTDNWIQATGKTFQNTGNTITNRILKFGQNMINGGAVLANVGTDVVEGTAGLAGADAQLGGSDDFGRLDNWADTWSQSITEYLLPENSGLYENGKFKGFDNLISGVAGTMTDMGLLLGTGALSGGGTAGIMASSGVMATGQAYQDALSKGLSEEDAQRYAIIRGAVEGSLEALGPQKFTRGMFSQKSMDDLMEQMGKETLTNKDIARYMLEEGLEENAQEFAQMIGEKTINTYTNAALGADFEDQYTAEELKETAILTTATSLLMAGLSAKSQLNQQQYQAAAILAENQAQFEQYLNDKIDEGALTIEAAQAAMNTVQKAGAKANEQQVEELAGKGPKPRLRGVRQPDGTYDWVPVEQEQAALSALEELEQQNAQEVEAEISRLESEIDDILEMNRYAADKAYTRKIDEKKGRIAELKGEQSTAQSETVTYNNQQFTRVEGKWHRVKKDGTPYKRPTSNQKAIESEFSGVQPSTVEDTAVQKEPTQPRKPRKARVQKQAKQTQAEEVVQEEVFEPAPEQTELPPQEVIEPAELEAPEPLSWQRGDNLVKAKSVLEQFLARRDEGSEMDGDFENAERAFKAALGILPKRLREEAQAIFNPQPEDTKGTKATKSRTRKEKRELAPETFEMTEAPTKREVASKLDPTKVYEPTEGSPEVGSVVEFEGDQFIVREQRGNKFNLITPDGKGGAKGVTAKELTLLKESTESFTDGSTIVYEGKPATVNITEDGYKITSEQGETTLENTEENQAALAEAFAVAKKKARYEKAKQDVKDQLNDSSLRAVFDPKDEAYRTTQFFKALTELAVSWIDYNGSVAYSRFKRSLPAKIRTQVPDEIIRDAFQNNSAYQIQSLKTATKRAEQLEGMTGDKRSKGVETLEESPLLTDEQKAQLKAKRWKYWSRSFAESEGMTAAVLNEMGLDSAYDDYIKPTGPFGSVIPNSLRPWIGKAMIVALNDRGNPDDARKAAEVAERMVLDGQDFGRGLGAFRGLTKLTPEGLQIWAAKQVTTTKDMLKKRNARKVDLALAKLEKAKREVISSHTDVLDRAYIQQQKRQAWNEFKKYGLGQASAGLDPRALRAAVKLGYYTILGGVHTFKTFAKRMKRTKLSKDQIAEVWNTTLSPTSPYTLSDIAKEAHLDDIAAALGTPELSAVLSNLEVPQPDKAAKRINSAFRRSVSKALKPQIDKSNNIEKELMAMAAKRTNLTKEDLESAFSLNEDIADIVAEGYQLMEAAPFEFQKVEIAKDIAVDVTKRLGKISFSSLAMSLWYASILSGVGTQVLNTGSNALNTIFEGIVQTPITFSKAGLEGNKEAVKGLLRGWSRGITEAKAIWQQGVNPTRRSNKFYEADPLENFEFSPKEFSRLLKNDSPKRAFSYLLGGYPAIMKYVPRAMSAVDAFFYHGLYEAQASAYAAEQSRRIKDPTTRKKEFERLMGWASGPFESSFEAAQQEAQAKFEDAGMEYTQTDLNRAAQEIITKRSSTSDSAHRFASKGTFNYDPEGLLGKISETLQFAGHKVPGFRFIVPFTRIVANVLNEQLNYSPWGFKRAAFGYVNKFDSKEGSTSAKSTREAQELLMKASIGTMLLPMVAMMLAGEDEEGLPLISGRGPVEYAEKKQLMDRGWKPYSIRMGDTWVNYQYTPASIPLTFLGNMYDLERYTDLDKLEVYSKSVANIGPAIFSMSFLSTLGDLFAALSEDDPLRPGLPYFLKSQTTKTAAGFIPNLLRGIDRATDPSLQQDIGFQETIMRSVPFVRRMIDRPALNAFGEPVSIKANPFAIGLGLNRFASAATEDEITSVFSRKNYVIPGIGKTTRVGGIELKNSPEDYYDYSMLVGRYFRKHLEIDKFKDLDPKTFRKIMDRRFKSSRDIIKRLMPHKSTPEIMKLLDLGRMPY